MGDSLQLHSKNSKQPIDMGIKITDEKSYEDTDCGWERIVKPTDMEKYVILFDTLPKESDGRVKVSHIARLMSERVSSAVSFADRMELLNKIWRMSSFDRSRRMDKDEFALTMHLCDIVGSGKKMPSALKWYQVPPAKRKKYFGVLALYWLDYKGKEVKYWTDGRQQTFVGHPWKFFDRSGVFLGAYDPSLPNRVHVIEIDV